PAPPETHTLSLHDALPIFAVDTVGGPVLLTRDQHGELHAFANYCRHRGAQLAEGAGRRQRLVCPYHAWSFGLDGSLLRAPGMERSEEHTSELQSRENLVCR